MEKLGLALALVGFFTSALSGIAGLGGGTILVGVLYALGMAPVEAVPLFAAVQVVSNATRTVAFIRHVEWRAAGWFMLAAIPSTLMLAPFADRVDGNVVRLVLAGLILASLAPGRGGQAPLPPRASFVFAGTLNGSLGMFVGATGLVVGRLFLRPEWTKERTIATLALTQVLGHALRVVAYGFAGFSAFARPALFVPLAVSVIAGTWAGKALNKRLDESQFAMLFKVILVVLSVKLVFDSARGFGWI